MTFFSFDIFFMKYSACFENHATDNQLTNNLNFAESQYKWAELIPWYNMKVWLLYHSL
jgi:hypothetical protein